VKNTVKFGLLIKVQLVTLGEFLPTFIWDDVTQTVSKDAPGGHVSTAWVVKVREMI